MNRAFLSDLALRVSLHPSCRMELRHHWPAPHYHKTPQDIAEEEEGIARCQATRAAAANRGNDGDVCVGSEPFNPFHHFRVRKNRQDMRHPHRRRAQHCVDATSKEAPLAAVAGSDRRCSSSSGGSRSAAAGRGSAAAATEEEESIKRTIGTCSPSSKSASSTPRLATTSPKARANTDAKMKASQLPAPTRTATQAGEKGINMKKSNLNSSNSKATTPTNKPTSTHAKMPLKKKEEEAEAKAATRKQTSRSSSSSTSSSSSLSSGSRWQDSDLDSDEFVPCVDPLHIRLPHSSAHHATGGVPRPLHVTVRWSGAQQRRRRLLRQLRRRQSEAGAAAATPQRRVTMAPSALEAVNNSETSPCPSDPHPTHTTTITNTTTSAFAMPRTHRRPSTVTTAMTEEEEDFERDSHNLRSCSSDVKGHGDGASSTRPPVASITAGGGGVSASASASVATSHSLRPPSTMDEVSLLNCSVPSVEVRQLQDGGGGGGQKEVGKTTSVEKTTSGGGAHSHASARAPQHQHQQHAAEDAEAHYNTCYNLSSTAAVSGSSSQQQPYYTRQPACKSATIFSQSTTTAPHTSLLGITSSELPTPSSSADPYAATFAPRYLRRPTSLLLVRSQPQDTNSSEDAFAAASGLYYYSCPAVYSRTSTNNNTIANTNTNTTGSITGVVGSHGLQASASNLRVTYVTSNANRGGVNNNSSLGTSADGGANTQQSQQQQHQQPRGLARVPRPYALTISGQGGLQESSSYSTVDAAGVNSPITPPNSLPSTPLQLSSLPNSTTYNSAAAATAAAGVRGRPASVAVPVGQQTPPPLTMKTVMVQRRRSSLLRQQAQQQVQAQQQQRTPSFGFFLSPEAVAASIMCKKQMSPTFATPAKLQRVQSAASSTADTVAFSPLNVNVEEAKSTVSSQSPPAPRGPMSVDAHEPSPLPCGASPEARLEKSASPSEASGERQRTTLHQDPTQLGSYGVDAAAGLCGYPPMYPQRDPSGLSTNGGGSSLRLLRGLQHHPSRTDVPFTAPYGVSDGSFGLGGGGGGVCDDSFGAGVGAGHNLNYTSSSLPATQHYAATFQSFSFPTAMWMDTGDSEFRDSSLLHPMQQHQHPESPLGPWAYTRPCFYAPSENSAWGEHTLHSTATPTAAFMPMMLRSSSFTNTNNNNNNYNTIMYSEPVTPMLVPQKRLSSLSPQQPQGPVSFSASSTPRVAQLLLPPSTSFPTDVQAAFVPPPRSRSNLVRALASSTSSGAPQVPEVFCKLQRSDVQRLRRRGPLLPPGTECPGLAGRLAYDAYREAVRRGLVKEEEECSYYLSHHKYTPLTTPTQTSHTQSSASVSVAAAEASSTPKSQRQSARASESSPTPSLRSHRPSALTPSARPLYVVSLADCRAASPAAFKKLQQQQQQQHHASSSSVNKAKDKNTSAEDNDGGGGDEQRSRSGSSLAQGGSELGESWNGPRLLYQIPRCCDDPYHRDEEALEMISITTTSSCAFGAGLDGLAWREWMPSSPVEAGEEILRSIASSSAAAAASASAHGHHNTSSYGSTAMASSSTHGPSPATTAGGISGSFHGPHSKTNAGFSGSTGFIVPTTTAAAAGTTGALAAGSATTPNNNSSSSGGGGVLLVPATPRGIVAPRNADDIGPTDAGEAFDNAQPNAPRQQQQHHHRTQTGTSGGSATDRAAGAPSSSSTSKRPFLAEWFVSKLHKHMEKKKQKKLKKQQEREAATVAAVLGGNGGSSSSASPQHTEECSPLLADPGLDRARLDARLAQSTTSTLSEYSDASSPHSSGSPQPRGAHATPAPAPETTALERQQQQQQQQRLAYLAAAYQTELVIYEQKRREELANRRSITALVECSRARMTPEAAAAGYFYETQADHHYHHHHLLLHPQQRADGRVASTPSPSPRPTAKAAGGVAARGRRNSSASSSASSSGTYSSSSGSDGYSQAVVSVASPVATEGVWATTPTKSPPAARATADRRRYAPDAELEEEEKCQANVEDAQQQRQQQSHDPYQDSAEEKARLDEQRRHARLLHARAMAEKVEAERVRVALDAVRTKQKSIENWMRAMRSQP